ncbi:MAG: hypothetical protein JWL84_4140 [Rhodospirillales bacterium]|jgi:hypothetical protein|nr:hypothetical protein [Rhodospirillales bacterium]
MTGILLTSRVVGSYLASSQIEQEDASHDPADDKTLRLLTLTRLCLGGAIVQAVGASLS